MTNEKLVPVFMPALVAMLVHAEDKKGSPLTKEQVLQIRDGAAVMMLDLSASNAMAESRGYADIDPENCWYDWQMARRDMGRTPELDPGVRFTFTDSSDNPMQRAVLDARGTLTVFRAMIADAKHAASALVKVKLAEPTYSANMWLLVTGGTAVDFSAELSEVPEEFKTFKAGDAFTVRDEDVLDWMVNDAGTLHGGYSLRVQRERLDASQRSAFDQHMGVERYA